MAVRDDEVYPGVPDGKELCLKAGRGGRWWSGARYADGIALAIRYVENFGLERNMRGLRGFGRQLIRIIVPRSPLFYESLSLSPSCWLYVLDVVILASGVFESEYVHAT